MCAKGVNRLCDIETLRPDLVLWNAERSSWQVTSGLPPRVAGSGQGRRTAMSAK